MVFSAFTYRADSEKRMYEISYRPDKAEEPVIAVADMLTYHRLTAKIADIVIVIINVIIRIKRQLFVAVNKFFTLVTVESV